MQKRRTRRPWGGGSITPTGTNRWKVRFDGPPKSDGSRRQIAERFDGNKKEAERYLANRLRNRDQGVLVRQSSDTLGQFITSWINRRAGDLSPRTVQGYREYFRGHIESTIGGIPLQSLQPIHVVDLYEQMRNRGLSNQTILHTHRLLNTALAAALRLNLVTRNVMEAVEKPKVRRKEPEMWTSEQYTIFMEAAEGSEFKEAFVLAAQTGMRRSELTGLRWQNVDLDEGVLYVRETLQRIYGQGLIIGVPKSERGRRRITLGQSAIALLRDMRIRQYEQQLASGGLFEGDYVLCDALGKPYDSGRLSREFNKIVKLTELPPLPLNSLRHLQASLLIAAGTHLRVIADRLGHSTTQLAADTYGHLYPDAQDEAAVAIDAAIGGV